MSQGAAACTISGNTIGQFGVSNDITIAGGTNGTYHAGILFVGTGSITCTANILQNVNLTMGTLAIQQIFYGIALWANPAGTSNISNNGIDNIATANNQTGSNTGSAVVGFLAYTLTGGTHNFTSNTVTDLSVTNTTVTCHMEGFYISGGTGATYTLSKNRVSGLTHLSTATNSTNYIACVRSTPTSGTVNLYNNVFINSNGSNTNIVGEYGIFINATGASYNVYHNTIKIGGSISPASGTVADAAFYTSATTGTYTIKNNIFQNVRTGGTQSHYGIYKTAAGPTWTETNNYLEGTTALANWQGTDKTTIAAWQTASSSGTNDKTGSISLASSGVCAAASSSDVKNTGTNLTATVADDIDGTTRSTTPYMGAYENTTALPIELLSFAATPVGKVVELNWTTITEINNDYFTVERSVDAIDFKSVVVVKGAGNSNTVINYMNTDIQPLKGISYYRLKQTDFDGKIGYSEIIAVYFTDNGVLNVFPNPTENTFALSFNANSDSNYILNLFDAKGSLIKSESYMTTEDGMNSLSVNIVGLDKGIYFMTLSNRNEMLKSTVIKE